MRPGTSRANCRGSVPPISRWPVSRHSLICEPASTRSTSLRVSTIVPTCGCSTASTPLSAAAVPSRSRLPSRVAHWPSSSVGPGVVSVGAGRRGQHENVGPAATSASSGPAMSGSGIVPGVVQQDRREGAHTAQPIRIQQGTSARRDRTAGSPRVPVRLRQARRHASRRVRVAGSAGNPTRAPRTHPRRLARQRSSS